MDQRASLGRESLMTKPPVAERITVPSIHLNGTSKGHLMDGFD